MFPGRLPGRGARREKREAFSDCTAATLDMRIVMTNPDREANTTPSDVTATDGERQRAVQRKPWPGAPRLTRLMVADTKSGGTIFTSMEGTCSSAPS
ncbi:MAG: hypothetical protein HYV63_09040 [Candidatus Schekmanbacteria bacterium]|nr:hypothetical protein [Candidatus Schekmanbacteria bacterium]